MSTPVFSFETLTPDIQLQAIESVGIYPLSGLLPLNSYENRVYQFQDENNTRWVVKFYRPQRWDNAQIHEEHCFTQALFDADIAVVPPLVINGETLFEFAGYRFSLFPSVGGRTFEVDNLDQLEMVARTLGKIHGVGQAMPFAARPTMGLQEYLYTPIDILKESHFIPTTLEKTFFSDLSLLASVIEKKWHTHWSPIALHGDCHPSNILWRDEPVFVDLDDARNGPAIQDIWLLLNGDIHDQRIQLDTITEAYEEFTAFPFEQLQLIEPLRSLRMVHYMSWLSKRWQDPAFPRAFPWFAEEKYWENQILGFKEQIAALDNPPLSPMSQW